MSGTGTLAVAPVVSRALWNWTIADGTSPIVAGYPVKGGTSPTKTGLLPQDLRDFVMIPLQIYRNPPVPVSDTTIIKWIRWAEDSIEQETGIRLCQTWVAAPPAKTAAITNVLNIDAKFNYQQLGIDYDVAEAAYDFFFPRAQDDGWMYQRLRWKPVRSVEYTDENGVFDAANLNGTKNLAYLYPLLNEYFHMPQSWIVEDQDKGLLRFVPSVNVAMLPLFALQLAFMGFSQSVPGGMWFQYTAGLTPNDYNSAYSFMQEYVLTKAAITALSLMQTSVNLGAMETSLTVDGMQYRSKYSENGAFSGAIKRFTEQEKALRKKAKSKVSGPVIGVL